MNELFSGRSLPGRGWRLQARVPHFWCVSKDPKLLHRIVPLHSHCLIRFWSFYFDRFDPRAGFLGHFNHKNGHLNSGLSECKISPSVCSHILVIFCAKINMLCFPGTPCWSPSPSSPPSSSASPSASSSPCASSAHPSSGLNLPYII